MKTKVKESFEINRCIKFAAIDESYDKCGIAIFDADVLIEVLCLDFSIIEKKTKTKLKKRHKRKYLKEAVEYLITKKGVQCFVVERQRLFSAGFISVNTISALAQLIACIVDAADGIPVVSIDTLTWKRATTGNPKRGTPVKEKKKLTLEWASSLLSKNVQEKRKYKPLNDDEADAIGIGVAFFKGVDIKDEE